MKAHFKNREAGDDLADCTNLYRAMRRTHVVAIELGVEVSRNVGLTRAQIEQVARRINAAEGHLIVFSRDGVVLHTDAEQRGTLALHGEIYSARRVGMEIEMARIPIQA